MTVKPKSGSRAVEAAILDGTRQNIDNEMSLTREEVSWIREALLIGLSCLGQVEKVISVRQVATLAGHQWMDVLDDIRHPTGSGGDAVSAFATALTTIDR
ncbi:hypothetical protein ABZR86_02000 [Dyella marensis]|uniref:Uncharacterized protein n=1 Tax=Dyella marensis TaxID=500610 RepID=A0A1I2A9W5_9GAMM|nr:MULTISPECIES: hypothetical protein [Dyella]SFE40636.1 hypothetical protein SAMN02799615_00969 [Dyella marensis]